MNLHRARREAKFVGIGSILAGAGMALGIFVIFWVNREGLNSLPQRELNAEAIQFGVKALKAIFFKMGAAVCLAFLTIGISAVILCKKVHQQWHLDQETDCLPSDDSRRMFQKAKVRGILSLFLGGVIGIIILLAYIFSRDFLSELPQQEPTPDLRAAFLKTLYAGMISMVGLGLALAAAGFNLLGLCKKVREEMTRAESIPLP